MARIIAGGLALAGFAALGALLAGDPFAGLSVACGSALAGLLLHGRGHRAALERLALLESAVVHARDAVIILEASPRPGLGRGVLYVNAAFCRMTGYPEAELLGQSLHKLRGPGTDPAALELVRRALDAGEPVQAELLNYRADGTELWVELSLVPVEGCGRRTHWVMIQRDIGERKLAGAELTARERQLRAIGDNIPGGAVYQLERTAAGARRLRYMSAGAESLVGVPATDLVESVQRFYDAVDPDDLPDLLAAEDAARVSLTAFDWEFRVRPRPGATPPGAVRTLHARAMPERRPDGSTLWNGVLIDTTDRHALEDQLRQSQKMETVGQLAGGIAHDFNNLLTGVLGNLALVELPEGDPNRTLIDTAERASRRASELTRKLLSFARKNQLQVRRLPVRELVEEIVGFVARTLDPRVRLVAECAADLPPVAGDAALVSQALLNLILNARDAMPGGGDITVGAGLAEYRPGGSGGGGGDARPFVCVEVRDTGVGMDPATAARLFEPFFTTKPLGQGTGLGLAMVHGIVRQHHGYVECDTAPGAGTSFKVYLPLAADELSRTPMPGGSAMALLASLAPAAPPAPPEPEPRPPEAGALILLVDDEQVIRDLARSVLEGAGYRVIEARDGSEAVEVFARRGAEIALVVLDYLMPVMSGRDALERIRGVDPGARVLFSSGYAEDDLCELAGVRGLLPKPYRPADLLGAVRAVLAGRAVPSASFAELNW